MIKPILEVKDVCKSFEVKGFMGKNKGTVSAVNHVSFEVQKKKTLGIVGESGCGKSTLARLLLRLIEPDQGVISLDGQDLLKLKSKEMSRTRKNLQMVFQNPYSSLNPKMTIVDNVAFNLWVNGQSKQTAQQQAMQFLEAVGLPQSFAARYPSSLSGGQRQRVAIARALITKPALLIADEAVSALDKSIQAQVLNLFQDFKEKLSLSLIFISHDLHVIEYMSDEVLVMYLGTVVERGPVYKVYNHPRHPYTQSLLGSALSMDLRHRTLDKEQLAKGELPSPLNPPSGCRFRTRCPMAESRCALEVPALIEVEPDQHVACVLQEAMRQ
jgi:oligopeptide/dipeptide ABC transporter ATP-binding protein